VLCRKRLAFASTWKQNTMSLPAEYRNFSGQSHPAHLQVYSNGSCGPNAQHTYLLVTRQSLQQQRIKLAACEGAHNGGKVVISKDHVSCMLGDRRAGAHSNADVGALQRRRIVHAVTCHRHHVPLHSQ
jgi:hypothetical protein